MKDVSGRTDQKRGVIIIFCGPPGAGKSTIARRLAEVLGDSIVLSTDQLGSRAYLKMEREVENNLGKHRYLILDGTFYKREQRNRIHDLTSGKVNLILVHVNCPLKVCLERNRLREKPIPDRGVISIWRAFERPESPDVYVDSLRLRPEQAVDLIINMVNKAQQTTAYDASS